MWIAKFTLSYNANGGTGAPGAQTHTVSVEDEFSSRSYTFSVSSTKPTRTGYTFTGWGASSVTLTATQSSPNASRTLSAGWKLNTYAVTYKANGGENAPASQTKKYGTTLKLTADEPTRNGYAFVRWNTQADGSGTNYNPGANYTSNSKLTLYAVWTQVASDVTNTGNKMGSAITLTITNHSSGTVTNTLTYAFGSASGTIATTTSALSLSWTPPTSLASEIPNATNGACTIRCETFVDGTSVGYLDSTFNLYVPDYTPTISVTLADGNTTALGLGMLVQGKSYYEGAVSTSTSYNATIVTYYVNVNGATYTNDNDFETDVFPTAGTFSWSAKVTDSRGRQGTASGTYTVTAYSVPSFSVSAVRDSNDDTQAVCSIVYSVSSLGDQNSKAYVCDWEEGQDTGTLPTYTGTKTITAAGLTISDAYTFEVTITDLFESVTRTASIPAADSIVFLVDHDTKDVHFRHKIYDENENEVVGGGSSHDLPVGGTTGQILKKASATDYDVAWATPSISWTTLWTNPSPSSSFAEQTVTLSSLANYQFVYIAARLATDSTTTKAGVMVPLGISAVKGGNISGASSSYAYFRGFTVNAANTEVGFTRAYRMDGSGTSAGNGYIIPYSIYGGKIS